MYTCFQRNVFLKYGASGPKIGNAERRSKRKRKILDVFTPKSNSYLCLTKDIELVFQIPVENKAQTAVVYGEGKGNTLRRLERVFISVY